MKLQQKKGSDSPQQPIGEVTFHRCKGADGIYILGCWWVYVGGKKVGYVRYSSITKDRPIWQAFKKVLIPMRASDGKTYVVENSFEHRKFVDVGKYPTRIEAVHGMLA